MAQLYFYYSAMNAGKTTALLQSSYNYQERGMHTVLYTAEMNYKNCRHEKIKSRVGLTASAKIFNVKTNFFDQIAAMYQDDIIHCVLIDECHFLNRDQVIDLGKIVDTLNVPVLCYGLRTDFKADLFPGSLWLLAWADKLIELKTICYCGRKANRVLRIDDQGVVIRDGNQILVGGNNRYVSVCRRHFLEKFELSFSSNKTCSPK
ncbi:thymidine kinase [Blochmannia endosymbiont of Camponotus sp.]|uniref:thymidine kinase n=1 Tax=Blochmannia endosymbiont of Camponotus sp. TaxID=700220 RepID=UPI0020253C85|nr:thymidine kinase [Blochmannia endosymbiont of Camponotus sp.]URJ31147.1 thymidine kinase [Blochmannia endosymbiont of Camponotus sp.]